MVRQPLQVRDGLCVAVIDSGWDTTLPEARVSPGVGVRWAPAKGTCSITDDYHDTNGHGTACADLLLQVSRHARVVPIRVFERDLSATPDVLLRALRCVPQLGARVVNLSLACDRADWLPIIYKSCRELASQGVVLVAAGVEARADFYPASFDCVIGVGYSRVARDREICYRDGEMLECRGREGGHEARSLGGATTLLRGTSSVAPIVSGLVADWLAEAPGLTLEEIRTGMQRSLRCDAVPASREALERAARR